MGIGMHAVRDQVAGAERAALVAEGLQCGVHVSALHVGNNSTIYL